VKQLAFGSGNEGGGEGFLKNCVLGSQLTGPILVKNPPLLRWVMGKIYEHRGENPPDTCPDYPLEEQSYAAACREMKARIDAK
jgi:CobQ-like glutamine amidotransferase family enzyme